MSFNSEFRDAPLAFFRKYSVVPPHDLGQKLVNLSTIFDSATASTKTDKGQVPVQSAEADASRQIMFIDFKRTTSLNEPNALTFSGTTARGSGDAVPVYFLPWRSMHLVSLRIPEILERDLGQPPDSNPGLFFTAAINGCSVFARGDPRKPQLYHGGIDGSLKVRSTDFWRECLDNVLKSRGERPGVVGEVHSPDYVKDRDFSGGAATPLAAEYKAWLQDTYRDTFTVQEVAPWGCVFGIRYGRLWSFYLQENATITTLEFIKKKSVDFSNKDWPKTKGTGLQVQKVKQEKSFLGIKYTDTLYAAKRTTSKPMRVRSFYPSGEAILKVSDEYRML